jgi:hypothetical protein
VKLNNLLLVGFVFVVLLVASNGREDSAADVKPVSKSPITFSGGGGGGGGGGGSSVMTATLKVYSDASTASEISNADWGSLSTGESKTLTVYLVSNVDLSVSVRAVNPVPYDLFLFADFSGDNIVLMADVVSAFSFTLSVHPDMTGISDFNFVVEFVGVS